MVSINTTQRTIEEQLRYWIQVLSTLYTDDHRAYFGVLAYYEHEVVTHSKWKFVEGDVHTNGIESFWSLLKRAYKGTYHYMSRKHLNRYVQEFVLRNNYRDKGTYGIMKITAHNRSYNDALKQEGIVDLPMWPQNSQTGFSGGLKKA